jgi:ABC-type branched-subunit amino acid transport system substrate-binding protein
MDEYQIWTLWSSNRIGSGLGFIGTVLLLWLAIRVAASTRASDETNLFAKLVSTAFGILSIGATWNIWTTIAATRVVAAANLNALEEKSQMALAYVEMTGTTVTGTPSTPGMILLAVIAIMILGQIWAPKK